MWEHPCSKSTRFDGILRHANARRPHQTGDCSLAYHAGLCKGQVKPAKTASLLTLRKCMQTGLAAAIANSMAMKSQAGDKRIFDLRCVAMNDEQVPRVTLSVSADNTLLDLHRAVRAAFGSFDEAPYAFSIAGTSYEGSKGSRTPLRRQLTVGDVIHYRDEEFGSFEVTVEASHTVATRRHYPKVTEILKPFGEASDPASASYDARMVLQRDFPREESLERRVMRNLRKINPDSMPSECIEVLHGFFSAIICGPLLPSHWLPVLFGDHEWTSMDEMRESVGDVMSYYNEVCHMFEKGDLPLAYLGKAWCEGYLLGVALAGDQWQEAIRDAALHVAMDPIVQSAGDVCASPHELVKAVFTVRDWWREHIMHQIQARTLRAV